MTHRAVPLWQLVPLTSFTGPYGMICGTDGMVVLETAAGALVHGLDNGRSVGHERRFFRTYGLSLAQS